MYLTWVIHRYNTAHVFIFCVRTTRGFQRHEYKGKAGKGIFGYEPVESNELLMAEGDTITNIDMLDEDWWAGKLRGILGMFPVTS